MFKINAVFLAASIKIREAHKHTNPSFTPSFTKVAEVKTRAVHNLDFLDDMNIPS